ncbi:hypothetical protein FHX49_001274 [Microbacterium endophyticum]|uniref:Uncharacterized protein n=1 Tax=Microbacterium endophyticum TaxID=1526412 RepID=A0A7W4V2J6_9MICO|nr:hypothetical protein [Microbacterium endophyticum]MBB2975707.1 hypothetical protein [Microbacterium endophyticum]NIK36190.1 hypothetical protein [Microbacterium endophyticum]
MKEVWIVYHDSGPDNNILGVFDNPADAYEYQELVGPDYPKGALLTPFQVPWRSSDRQTTIQI